MGVFARPVKPFTTVERRAVEHLTLCGVPAINVAATLGRAPGTVHAWRAKLGLTNPDNVRVKTSSLTFSRSTYAALAAFARTHKLKITRATTIVTEVAVRNGALDEIVRPSQLPRSPSRNAVTEAADRSLQVQAMPTPSRPETAMCGLPTPIVTIELAARVQSSPTFVMTI
jgi:hypothetical protein